MNTQTLGLCEHSHPYTDSPRFEVRFPKGKVTFGSYMFYELDEAIAFATLWSESVIDRRTSLVVFNSKMVR